MICTKRSYLLDFLFYCLVFITITIAQSNQKPIFIYSDTSSPKRTRSLKKNNKVQKANSYTTPANLYTAAFNFFHLHSSETNNFLVFCFINLGS